MVMELSLLVGVKGLLEMYETNSKPYGFALLMHLLDKFLIPTWTAFLAALNMFQFES
jgi:hypothetical protein